GDSLGERAVEPPARTGDLELDTLAGLARCRATGARRAQERRTQGDHAQADQLLLQLEETPTDAVRLLLQLRALCGARERAVERAERVREQSVRRRDEFVQLFERDAHADRCA